MGEAPRDGVGASPTAPVSRKLPSAPALRWEYASRRSHNCGGDSFASRLIYGLLTGRGPAWSVECGAAHGALAMTTPGDTSMATLPEVERVMKGGTARVSR